MREMRSRVGCKDPTILSDNGIILYCNNIIPVLKTKYCYCYTNMHARTITIILACIHVRYGKYTSILILYSTVYLRLTIGNTTVLLTHPLGARCKQRSSKKYSRQA